MTPNRANKHRTKRCKCCHKRKGLDAFLRAPRERDGLMRSCASCVGARDGIRARLSLNAPLQPHHGAEEAP